jgi:hypothetical protein
MPPSSSQRFVHDVVPSGTESGQFFAVGVAFGRHDTFPVSHVSPPSNLDKAFELRSNPIQMDLPGYNFLGSQAKKLILYFCLMHLFFLLSEPVKKSPLKDFLCPDPATIPINDTLRQNQTDAVYLKLFICALSLECREQPEGKKRQKSPEMALVYLMYNNNFYFIFVKRMGYF